MFKLHPQLIADTIPVGDLQLCRVLLINDSNFPWLVLVPRRNNIQEIYQLDETDRQQLEIESNTISKLIMSKFNGDKLNIAALGNLVPQLHIHHIVRYKSDPAWPKPVWGSLTNRPYDAEFASDLVHNLASLISEKLDLQIC